MDFFKRLLLSLSVCLSIYLIFPPNAQTISAITAIDRNTARIPSIFRFAVIRIFFPIADSQTVTNPS